ncbi:MAG: RsmD family RNA methyltransferase [Deltaproteobacteria bacterium]|jgi:16S rRNA (guanine966-N2)-methyltransferase|nr:RsmD family RNA methyltransferase [Deltaproteobacteria bacterium]
MAVRIIGGLFRGLNLSQPRARDVRPTSAMVREAIFSILGRDVLVGAKVLDMYAGSGAMGLEALSRGASDVLLTDCSRPVLNVVRDNVARLPQNYREMAGDARCRYPKDFPKLKARGPFTLFFLDPPYKNDIADVLAFLSYAARDKLALPGASLVWEQAPESLGKWDDSAAAPWEVWLRRKWGDRAAALLRLPDASGQDDFEGDAGGHSDAGSGSGSEDGSRDGSEDDSGKCSE